MCKAPSIGLLSEPAMGLRLHPADLIAQIVLVLHPRTFYEVTPRAVVYFVSSEYVRIELADDINYAVDQIQLIFLVFNLYWGLLSNSLSDAVFVREAQNAGTWAVGSRIFLTLHAPENALDLVLSRVWYKRTSRIHVYFQAHDAHVLRLVLDAGRILFQRVFEAMWILLCWTFDL
jgi:hypothetical protein